MKQKNIIALSLVLITGLLISSADAQERRQGRRGGPDGSHHQFERGDHPRRGAGMPEEKLNEIIDKFNELEPGLKDLFEELKETDNKSLKKHMRDLAHNPACRFAGRKKSDGGQELLAKTLKLELESLKISNQIAASTDEAEKESLKNNLRNKLYDAFEAKNAIRDYHIQMLTKKLEEVRQQNEERQSNKDQIVEKRLNELIENHTNLEW